MRCCYSAPASGPRSTSFLALSLRPMHCYMSRSTILLCLVTLLAVGTGCRREEGIRRYRVPKEHVLLATNGPSADDAPTAAADYRMLAAMIPRGQQAWFFRVIGPAETVGQHLDEFRALVKSIRFADEDAAPEWTLPEGWRQKPGSGMRHATLEIDAPTGVLELSVTSLPRTEPDLDAYTLSNLNRWRGQLGLAPLSMSRLRESVEQVDLARAQATLVDLVGHKPQDTMGRAPFAAAASPASPIEHDPNAYDKRPAATRELSYEVPAGWQETPAGGMRKAAFTVQSGEQTAEVTVITLDAAGGSALANVNRWRQQVGLEPIDEQALATASQKIDIAGSPAEYVALDWSHGDDPGRHGATRRPVLVHQDERRLASGRERKVEFRGIRAAL